MGWKDDKNLGAWDFTPQQNKPFYNEGDHMATYESPVWSMAEGTNVPITPTHKPCGYWTKGLSYWTEGLLLPWILPWAWFRFDERTGYLVTDYGPLNLPGYIDGAIFYPPPPSEAQMDSFWNTNPGFGHNGTHPVTYGFSRYTGILGYSGEARPGKYSSVLAFIRPLAPSGGVSALQIGETAALPGFAIGWSSVVPYYWVLNGFDIFGEGLATESPTFGKWYCVYAYQSKNMGTAELYIRESGNPFRKIISLICTPGNTSGLIHGLLAFGGTTSTCVMDGGDFLYYADETAGSGVIDLVYANYLYSLLKSRYGMN